MSVLRENRSVSKAEYVRNSREIAVRSINLLSRLSARYARVLGDDFKNLAISQFSDCARANSIYPSSFARCDMREMLLVSAKSKIDALDAYASLIYEILRQNPEGAFTDVSGKKSLDAQKANQKLDKMVDMFGDALSKQQALLTGCLEHLKKVRAKLKKNTVASSIAAGCTPEQAQARADYLGGVQVESLTKDVLGDMGMPSSLGLSAPATPNQMPNPILPDTALEATLYMPGQVTVEKAMKPDPKGTLIQAQQVMPQVNVQVPVQPTE